MNWHFEQQVNLKHPVGAKSWPDPLMVQGDNLAHEWRVYVSNNGHPMDLTGYMVTAYFNRSDGKTVPVTGTADGSVASVVLPQSVYASAGILTGLLRAWKDGENITLAAGSWTVRHGPGDEIVDPGHVVPSLEELLAKISEMEETTNAANAATATANAAADQANEAAASIDAKIESALAPVIEDIDALRDDIAPLIRQDMDGSMSQIASYIRAHTPEQNARIFPIGDQIIMPWKDMDDRAHNTEETAYHVAWDIVHHGMVTLQDGREVPGMYLMMHKCSSQRIQFSHGQAFYQAAQALSAGTYHVNFGVKYNNTFTAGTSGQFTLTGNVPAGGRLWLSGANVQVFASATAASPAETVPMTLGNGGTELGTISSNNTVSDTGLNAMLRILTGHNRWSTSAIRQYLNSTGANWFTSREDFDIRPDQYNKQGFMSGFGDDFLNAIKPVKVTTALNTAEGFKDASEDTFDTFFLPSLEQLNATPEAAGVEGDYFEYWRSRLGLTDFADVPSTAYDGYKIPAIDDNSPQYALLRSANRTNPCNMWLVYTSGKISNGGNASASTYRHVPVCVVC